MSNLGPQKQNSSYAGILQIPGGITSSLQTVTDGLGNATGLSISTTAISGIGIVSSTAQNLYGGVAGAIVYQSAAGATSFVVPGTTGQLLSTNGGLAPTFVTVDANYVDAVATSGDSMTGALNMTGNLITNLATPVASTDAATKAYVDSIATGLQVKTAATCATTTNLASLSGLLTIDGVTVTAGQRVLVKNQTASQNNGIYVAAAGAWSRSTDADSWAELVGAAVFVTSGSVNGSTTWVCNVAPNGTLGTTSVTFVQFGASSSYTAGTGLTLAGNQFSITAPVTPALGGTGVTSLTGIPYGNNTSAFTVATGSQIASQIGSNAVAKATNIAGGGANRIPYQSATDTTGFLPAGTSGQILTSGGSGAVPFWQDNNNGIWYGATPPVDTTLYPQWWNTTNGTLYVYYATNGTGPTWVESDANGVGSGNSYLTVSRNGTPVANAVARLSSDMFGDYINVMDFGAYNDATHTAETTTAFQNAISYVQGLGGGTIYIPCGSYSVNSIQITGSNISIIGGGTNSTVLRPATSGINVVYGTNIANILVEGLAIECASGISNITGFSFVETERVVLSGVRVNGAVTAFYLDRGKSHKLLDCMSSGNTYYPAGSLVLTSTTTTGTDPWIFSTHVHNYTCQNTGNGTISPCIQVTRGIGVFFQQIQLTDVTTGGNGSIGIRFTGDCQGCTVDTLIMGRPNYGLFIEKGTDAYPPTFCKFVNFDIDQGLIAPVVVDASSYHIFDNMFITAGGGNLGATAFTIQGNSDFLTLSKIYFSNYSDPTGHGIAMTNCGNVVITDCTFVSCTTGIGFVSNCYRCLVQGNTFYTDVTTPITGSLNSQSNYIVNNIGASLTANSPTVAVPASGVAQSNVYAAPATVYVQGTLNSVTVSGKTINGFTGSLSFRVLPSQDITLNYSGATPTWNWILE